MPTNGGTSQPGSSGGCPDALTLAAYLDGKLDTAELASLERHISSCAKCSKDVAELREILSQIELDPQHSEMVNEIARRAKKIIDG